ncbi:ATP-binding protein [Burkholderia sp. Bp9142]|uniref:ATP-binding protein n=1 Tax=Burkholderia sp. Bp9142 TaxID=2184573 RepID=UPI000F59B659|nr:ATP-binding protein [Burkholderia sp. Bp9142]RQR26176.1 ATP-binding protein [Burkholderia sp. Bp9142]
MNADDLTLDYARLFAALSGPFVPKQALQPWTSRDNLDRLAMVATRLAEVCDTSPIGAGGHWLMRTPARHSLLKSLAPSELVAAVVERRKSVPDSETTDLLAVLLDEPPLARADIRAIIDAQSDQAKLERVIVALDRAGEVAPSNDLLQSARSALSEFHRAENRRRIAERGFFGRDSESAGIAEWLSRPIEVAPVACLLVTGGPGIGKSTLLAESVRRYHERDNPLVLRLDFDRAGLDVQDQLGLTMEAARQLAEQLGATGDDLLNARLDAGTVFDLDVNRHSSLRQRGPESLVAKLGETVVAAGRPVLVVLDTLEVLRGRGETHPITLFRWLDSLVASGVKPMCVLAAGRGDALDSLEQIGSVGSGSTTADWGTRRVTRMELLGLEADAARALLAKLGTPSGLQNEMLEIAQGNPLKLRLAAEIGRRLGVEHLPKRKRGSEVSAAFLYRMLLSRIDEPDLRRLAHPGLIVRRINADVIRRVMAPTLGLGAITQDRASELLNQLAAHHWLVENDPGAPGFLKHRSDMRTLLLPLLYNSSPKQSARIDAAALRWFAAQPQPWAEVEAVYHELQLTRVGRAAPSVPFKVAAQFDLEALDELPRAAADLVLATRGERTSQFRGSQSTVGASGDDAGVTRELLAIIQRQDWREGEYLVRGMLDAGGLDVRSQAADALRTFLWRSGQWAKARLWLRERNRFDESDEDLADLPEPLALARLEMRAEFEPERLRRQWRSWRPLMSRLEGTATAATDNCARHGALALLLANLPEPFHFSQRKSRESDLAAAANERWVGVEGREAAHADELGRQRLGQAARYAEDATGLLPGRILATLTPYSTFADNLLFSEGSADLRGAAESSAEAIARNGGLLGDRQLELNVSRTGRQIAWLADLGLFAEWAGATSFVLRNEDLGLIGRAAERWRRTMAGDWSIGIRRGEWRRLPRLDETLRGRLRELMEAPNPVSRAREQLDIWTVGLPTDALLQRLQRRLRGALSEGARLVAEGEAVDVITRRLLVYGAPAAFVPPLAVLLVHREL